MPSSAGDQDWSGDDGGDEVALNELPSMEDPFIQRYLQGRDALISQESKQRSDYAFRQSLSPMAAEASAIVSKIRDEERRTIWTEALEAGLSQKGGEIYPGAMFALAKERMESTVLWKIIQRMPKGALLHAHFEAMVDIGWLIDQAFATKGMHIYAPAALCSPSSLESGSVLFRFSTTTPQQSSMIWSDDYTPSTLIPMDSAADSFPNGGRSGFMRWLKDRCTITAGESIQHHHGPNAIWRKFQSTFLILNSIIHYEPILRAFTRRLFQQLALDGVRWVDLRAVFLHPYWREGCDIPDQGFEEMIRVLKDELVKFQATEEGKYFWGCRMIWTVLRRLQTHMDQCIAVKKAFPDMIAGFDFVGQEEAGRPLKDLLPEIFWFRKRCAEEGVEIPFFFHAGECLGDGDETDYNLVDAIVLGTRRIGHGFSLYKHPLLIDMIKDKKILVESCPISNEILRFTSSIMSHPLPALLSRGVPVALCNDDPAILGQEASGMTHDFWQALQGMEQLGLEGLGALAENSVRWAAFEDQAAKDWTKDIKDGTFGGGIRAARMKEWLREWESFCQWVVMEFGVDEDGEEEEEEE
ncbi:MAG: hypothetical protein M1819_000763 [Sarea resinae]|nr:MAG: hypothetical protein M1819_000763 [Sarea resinae]